MFGSSACRLEEILEGTILQHCCTCGWNRRFEEMQALVGKELDYVWMDPGREAVVFESSACRLEEMQALVGKELYYRCTCGRTQVAKPRSLDAAFEDVVMVAAGGRAIRPWLRISGTL